MDWGILVTYREALLSGLRMTVGISAGTIVVALLLGVLVGCCRAMPNYYLVRVCELYADVLRNIPAVVKIFIAYFVFRLDPVGAGIVALSLHQSSYISDVIAAGIRSIPAGQMEAALSSGLSTRQAYSRVLLPQACRVTIPPMTTQFIQIVKNSSTVMLIAVEELTFMTRKIEHETFRGIEAAVAVTVIYLGLTLVIALAMGLIQHRIDRRLAK